MNLFTDPCYSKDFSKWEPVNPFFFVNTREIENRPSRRCNLLNILHDNCTFKPKTNRKIF